jgi:1-deoxy-D-xylulose 5-phosphate reductoisomerase
MSDYNIAPAGVLSGGPFEEHVIQEGDELILEARLHPAWLMGFRLSFK